MNATKEWPKILGFADGSTVDEKTVEQNYRRQAKVLHPDVGGSVDDMQQLNLAKSLALKWVECERRKLEQPPAVIAPNPYRSSQWDQAKYAGMAQSMNSMGGAAAQQANSKGWFSGILGGMFG